MKALGADSVSTSGLAVDGGGAVGAGSGGAAWGVKAGRAYVDVGTIEGYRAALDVLRREGAAPGGTTTRDGEDAWTVPL